MHHQKAVLCFYLNGMIEQNVLREKTEVRIQENIKIRRRDICMSSLEKCLFSLKNKKFKKKKRRRRRRKRDRVSPSKMSQRRTRKAEEKREKMVSRKPKGWESFQEWWEMCFHFLFYFLPSIYVVDIHSFILPCKEWWSF